VFIEIPCLLDFADEGFWRVRFRLERDEPIVLIEENFDDPGRGVFSFGLGGESYAIRTPLAWSLTGVYGLLCLKMPFLSSCARKALR